MVTFEADDEHEIRSAPDRLPGLVFVPVGDSMVTKNRPHLDFRPDDQTAEVDRLLALGAHRVDVGQGEQEWDHGARADVDNPRGGAVEHVPCSVPDVTCGSANWMLGRRGGSKYPFDSGRVL